LDDLLDVTASQEDIGKPAHSDSRNRKNTYVSVHGIEAARADYARISKQALSMLGAIPQKTPALLGVVRQVIDRKN
jgi:geranylgeranyl diphosphate synthase type II